MIIVLLSSIHLAVTYSGFGSWYYIEGTHLDTLSTVWFAFYQSFTQGYFLGFLFMISGYFVAGSYDRKGFGQFAGDRFKRLIIPTLIFMIAITPFIEIVELGNKHTGFNFWFSFRNWTDVVRSGAFWFFPDLWVGASGIPQVRSRFRQKQLKPTLGLAVSLILIIAVFAFLIRIVQPIGTDILNFQLCYFASYISPFHRGDLSLQKQPVRQDQLSSRKKMANRRHRFGLPCLVCTCGSCYCNRNHSCPCREG